MTVKFGFYDSLNGDRLYNANDFNTIFEGIFSDGVFEHVGDALIVEHNPGVMGVLVKTGRAWFNNSWIRNTSILSVVLTPSSLIHDRIDLIVLEFDSSITVRENSIKVVTGVPAAIPIPPVLANTSTLHQYALAEVLIPATSSEVLLTDITNKIGSVGTPYSRSLISEPSSGPVTTTLNDFQVGDGIGNWVTKTLAQTITILRTSLDSIYAAIIHNHSASDITSGTLNDSRLPLPTTTTLGGVARNIGATGEYVTGIDSSGNLEYDTPSSGGGGIASIDTIRTSYIITPSIVSNNLVIAIKYIDGNDPTSTNKLVFRVGNIEYSLTTAMSFTKNAGTDWCAVGGTRFAAKNVQYFLYAIGETGASAGLKFGFSRIPYAKTMADFVNVTTNEKYIAGNWTNFNGTDSVTNIGRFQAQNSGTASYNWSIPSVNVVNYPIYETDTLTWTPASSANGSMTFTSVTIDVAEYQIVGKNLRFELEAVGTIGGTVNHTVIASLPFSARNASYFPAFSGWVNTTGSSAIGGYCLYSSGSAYFRRYDFGNWSAGAGRYINGNGTFMI